MKDPLRVRAARIGALCALASIGPGLQQYKTGGFTLMTPTIYGSSSAVPAAIKSEVGG